MTSIPAGQPCLTIGQCVDHAECNLSAVPLPVCRCMPGFYYAGGSCVSNIPAGHVCSTPGQCVNNSECDPVSKKCLCFPEFYNELGRCREKIKPGRFCDGQNQCIEEARCDMEANVCVCNVGYFKDGVDCVLKLDAGISCSAENQCTQNAKCDAVENRCMCDTDYFNHNGKCKERVPAGKYCDGLGQCVQHAECNLVAAQCECATGYFRDDRAQCRELINHGEICEREETCTSNSSCKFVTNSTKNCVCHSEFYVHSGKCVARIPARQPCQSFGTCVDHAWCMPTTATCECQEGYYVDSLGSGTCNKLSSPGEPCHGPETCVNHAYCSSSTPSVCQCKNGYYSSEDECKPLVQIDSVCDVDEDKCVPNAECVSISPTHFRKDMLAASDLVHSLWPEVNRTSSSNPGNDIQTTCQCKEDYFAMTGGSTVACVPRRLAGESCWIAGMCVLGAECSSDDGWTCQCRADFYKDDTTRLCRERILAGQYCSQLGQCVENAECIAKTRPSSTKNVSIGVLDINIGTHDEKSCQCKEENYFQDETGVCQQRIPPGDVCSNNGQCVQNAECHDMSKTCVCNHGFYSISPNALGYTNTDLKRKCFERRTSGTPCTAEDQCVPNAECNITTRLCQCDTGHYDSSGSCVTKKPPGEVCEISLQCTAHATCVTNSNTRVSVCTCGEHYYAELGVCRRRLEPGQSCNTLDQCVQNAQCDPKTGTCRCSAHFYNTTLEGEKTLYLFD